MGVPRRKKRPEAGASKRSVRAANENIRVAAGKAPARPEAKAKPEAEAAAALPDTIEEILEIVDPAEAEEIAGQLAEKADVLAQDYKTVGVLAGAALLRAQMLEDEPEEGEE